MLIMIIPVLVSLWLLLEITLGKNSEQWPKVDGKLEAFVIKKRTSYSKFPSISGVQKQGIVKVKYSYLVNGRRYHSSRINFGLNDYYQSRAGLYLSPEEIREDQLTDKLNSNNFLVSYFKPVPRVAVLVPGLQHAKRLYSGVAFILGVGLFLSLVYYLCF